tara:strand:+ start:1867 stop:4971 length:3105 start_codon:yes stop_codon:yes gene_type:complete
MPITPLSTPLKTEYKPLGLEAFAEPLSKMQEKFDLTKNEINKTKYALNSFGQVDGARSKKLLNDLNEKTEDLSASLTKSGNYREAAIKLQELNSWFNNNKELSLIKSKYDNYKKTYDELNALRVESKGEAFTQEDLDNWDYKVKAQNKGTNYNKETGNYDVSDFTPKLFNQNRNIQEKVLELTKLATENENAFLSTLGKQFGASGEDAQRLIKMSKDGVNREQVAAEIRNFVLQDPQYRDWKIEDAQTKFFVQNDQTKKKATSAGSNPSEFSDNLILPTVEFLHTKSAELKKHLQREDLTDEQKKIIENDLEETDSELEDLYELYQNRQTNPEAYEKKAESIYVTQELGYFDNLAISAADLIDHIDTDFSGISSTGGVNTAVKTKMEGIGKINYSINTVATKRTGAHSTSVEEANTYVGTDDIAKVILSNETTLKNNLATKNINSDEGFGIINKKGKYFKYKELPHYFQNLADLSSIEEFSGKFDEKQTELEGEVTVLYSELKDAGNTYGINSPEYREITSKIINKNNKKSQIISAKTSQLKDLDFIVADFFTSLVDSEDLIFDIKTNNTDIVSDSFVEEFARRHDQKPEMIKEQLENIYELWQNNTENTEDFLNALQKESMYDQTIKLDLGGKEKENEVSAEFDNDNLEQSRDLYSLVLNEVFDRFKVSQSIGSEGYIQIPKVSATENVNKFSNGTMKVLLEEVARNTDPSSRASAVSFDGDKRTYKYKDPGVEGNYSLDLYGEEPAIVGRVPNEKGGPPRLLLAYQLKTEYASYNFGAAAYTQYFKKGGASWSQDYSAEEAQDEGKVKSITADEAAVFRKNNPSTLYLEVDQLISTDPIKEMEDNYVEFVTEGLNASDPNTKIDIIEQQRSNFAPIHLTSDPERAIEYSRMAKTLTENAQKGIESTEPQIHAYSNDNGDGTFTEYDIMYQTTTDNRILAQVTKSIRTPSSDPKIADEIKSIDLPSVILSGGNNLPLALLKMDMTFGTGQRNDAVLRTVRGVDSPFIIAFENASIFEGGDARELSNRMNNIIK